MNRSNSGALTWNSDPKNPHRALFGTYSLALGGRLVAPVDRLGGQEVLLIETTITKALRARGPSSFVGAFRDSAAKRQVDVGVRPHEQRVHL